MLREAIAPNGSKFNTFWGNAMIFGLSTATFTLLHVAISLVGILAGLIVVAEILQGRHGKVWTDTFLVTTIATSLTGFMFHSTSFGPPHVVGLISLVVLAIAVFALYGKHLAGFWRPAYVVSALTALYLNIFVGVVQAFQKVPFLQALAPTQSELPFIVAQAAVLVGFAAVGVFAFQRFHLIEQRT